MPKAAPAAGRTPASRAPASSPARESSPARLEGEANAVALRFAFGAASPPSAATLASMARAQAAGGAAPAGDGGMREQVGRALGYDFSGVRLEAGPDAGRRAARDGAHAVTRGSRVDFAAGRFRPDRPLGRGLIAHELAHVAQQGAAPRRADAGDRLHEAVHAGMEREAALTPAPPGAPLKLNCCLGFCGDEEKDAGSTGDAGTTDAGAKDGGTKDAGAKDAGTQDAGAKDAGAKEGEDAGAKAAASGPVVGGASKPKKPDAIVRLSWTFDDGPTKATTSMEAAIGKIPGTWFIMRSMLGEGADQATALKSLADKQAKGGEIGIHAFHPKTAHHAWYPVKVAPAVPKAYNDVPAAMADLTSFVALLTGAGVKPRFVRFPGGEYTETLNYLKSKGISSAKADPITRRILKGESVAGDGKAAAEVEADYKLILSTLAKLGLVLWGGTASGPMLKDNSWEAQAEPAGSDLTNNVMAKFTWAVDTAAKEGQPRSLVILAHDTVKLNATAVKGYVADMEAYAVKKDVRLEYYTMSGLFQAVRGKAP